MKILSNASALFQQAFLSADDGRQMCRPWWTDVFTIVSSAADDGRQLKMHTRFFMVCLG
ncbi:hypothetical protein I6E24_08775 [Bacteroides caecigallinarum]|nr:hypothetical protein [Bacteroides caecigallinarum]